MRIKRAAPTPPSPFSGPPTCPTAAPSSACFGCPQNSRGRQLNTRQTHSHTPTHTHTHSQCSPCNKWNASNSPPSLSMLPQLRIVQCIWNKREMSILAQHFRFNFCAHHSKQLCEGKPRPGPDSGAGLGPGHRGLVGLTSAIPQLTCSATLCCAVPCSP